jgi:Methylmalonyl-CoA mutase, N-terminal domain/subunit
MAAVFGGTQSLHTNSLDEAIALPSEDAAKIARNTQIFIQNETNICKSIDPLGGSHYLEKLTYSLVKKSWEIIKEIEAKGGMTKAIELGIPKKSIEEAAAKRQARIDTDQEIIIGQNAFKSNQNRDIETLEIDNHEVRSKQIERINKIKSKRNSEKVIKVLNKLTDCAKNNKGNLLEISIEAARERATLGEISNALEIVFGRYKATINTISGVYSSEIMDEKKYNKAIELVEKI